MKAKYVKVSAVVLGLQVTPLWAACPISAAATPIDFGAKLLQSFDAFPRPLSPVARRSGSDRAGRAERNRDQRILGSYSVPLAEGREDLNEVASFPVEYRVRDRDGVPEISYDLPELLTGAHNDIRLRPIEGASDRWGGSNSIGECAPSDEGFRCQLGYRDLVGDEAAAAQLIAAVEPSPELAQKRLEVAVAFITEPCGILSLPGFRLK